MMGYFRTEPAWRRHALAPLLIAVGVAAAPVAADSVAEGIRLRLERAGLPAVLAVDGEPVHASTALPAFYERRGFAPAWSQDGRFTDRAGALLRFLDGMEGLGLSPGDYHRVAIAAQLAAARPDVSELVAADLLLTDSFLVVAAHLVGGRVDPTTLEKDWIAARREVDLPALLESVVAGRPVRQALESLQPADPGYRRLSAALRRYRDIRDHGGWPRVGAGEALRPGDRRDEIVALRRRLEATGDHDGAPAAEPEFYDDALRRAVVAFQARHGLDEDAVVGRKTLEALNVGVEERIRQIELNLERWRWLPLDLGERHVLVNVPEYRLRLREAGAETMSMRVIVGRTARRTPVFSDLMRYLVFSPSWEIPPTILRQDKLPELRKDPSYAAAQQMQVFLRDGAQWTEVDPLAVDWSSVTAGSVRLRQRPGPWNALGGVKFMFPNAFSVYLHDTPARELFAKADRDLSSGCVRLERPADLAVALLEDPAWTPEAVQAAMTSGSETTVRLSRPVPVHLQHWTTWVEDDGRVAFRSDLYGRDKKLSEALHRASRDAKSNP